MLSAWCLTHTQSLSGVVSVGRAPALRLLLLLTISLFPSALRIDNLHFHFTPRLSLHSTAVISPWVTQILLRKGKPSLCQADSEGACFGLHCSGIRAWRIGAVFSRVSLGSGRLVIAAAPCCAAKSAVVDRGSLLFHQKRRNHAKIVGNCERLAASGKANIRASWSV